MTRRAADLRRSLRELAAPDEPDMSTICKAAVSICGVDAAAVLIGRGERRGALHTTDRTSAVMEDLQITVGEGPSVDAWEARDPAMHPDLSHPGLLDRWPGFAPLAHGEGVRAVFAFPLQVGAVRLGTLSLYRYRPGPLAQEQSGDAMLLAGIALDQLLALSQQSGGQERAALGVGEDSLKIYQATGMAASQMAVPIEEAFSRLRAHAFSAGLPLSSIAEQLLEGVVTFEPQDNDGHDHDRSTDHNEEE
ncbi:GAF and ANTAR domain-containing protein [Streptomyces sp. NPDC006879]|uniref:GAF and ANTAR domain-containing protein n=1 Tax=Streptomyces sp. NPDC006879 TaxID=3364767 RepID=UPI0036A9CC05